MPSNHAHHADHSHDHDKPHGPTKGGLECCTHHNIKLERYTVVYLVGGVLLLATLAAQTILAGAISAETANLPAILGTILLGAPLVYAAILEIRQGRTSTSSLAALAIIAAFATEEYLTAGLLAFILLIADQFVRQRAWGAERAIEELIQLTPDVARRVDAGGEQEVALAAIKVGDLVRVRPGENLPVDGTVASGQSTLNQASLTGEAAPHEVTTGDPVYAGTVNLSGVLDIRVTQVGEDTTIGKVSSLIREAEQSRTPKQLLVEQVAQFFVPVAVFVAGLVWFLTGRLETAISVLVVVCPSALLLSSPLAMVAAFASSARLGILIKRTNYLESAATIDTVIFDKTGTLTTGRFAVSRLVPAQGVEGADLLQAAANGEQHSNHPLAKSILQTAQSARIVPDGSKDFEEVHGRGVIARTSSGVLHVGRASWIREQIPGALAEIADVESRIEGMTGVHVVKDGRYMGVVGLEDRVRPNAKGVVARLREIGVRSVTMLTGDRLSVAERVGRSLDVDTIEAECLPEEKHAIVKELSASGRRIMMVGDGINDGPSLASADVGIAMGLGGSDIAANSAGVALMNDDLSRCAFLIELSRRTRAVIAQNIAASILIALLGLSLAATGGLTLILAALYHVVGDIFVIANSFRLVRFGEEYTELESEQPAAAVTPRGSKKLALQPATA